MSGGTVRHAVVALLVTGCLREPTFTPRDGGPDPDAPDGIDPSACADTATNVAVRAVGGGVRVCGPRYQVDFSERGAHFPSQLVVDGTPLLADGARCNDERGIGVALYPSLIVNGEDRAMVSGTIGIELGSATDAIAKVGIDWSASYTCGSDTLLGALGNRTTFTFFPDGRVSRQDRLAHTGDVDAGACSTCEPTTANDPFYLTSFTTLAAADAAALVGANGTASQLETYGDSIDATDSVCLATRDRAVGFGWRASTSTRSRVRLARERTPQEPAAFAFTFDRLQGAAAITPTTAETLLRTTMILGPAGSTCTTALDRVGALATDVPIDLAYGIGGGAPGSTSLIANLDGIYGGEDENQAPGFDVPGDPTLPMTLAIPMTGTPVTGGFAVWLDLANHYPTINVTKSPLPAGPDWYRLQRAEHPVTGALSQIVLWFPDGLAVGETITIDAEP